MNTTGKTIFLVCKWLFLLLEMYTSCILRSVSELGLYLASPRPAKTDPSLDLPFFPCNKNTSVSEGWYQYLAGGVVTDLGEASWSHHFSLVQRQNKQNT